MYPSETPIPWNFLPEKTIQSVLNVNTITSQYICMHDSRMKLLVRNLFYTEILEQFSQISCKEWIDVESISWKDISNFFLVIQEKLG